MLMLIIGILSRIVSNSYLNVFQKILTLNGEKSSVVNFYTYFGLSVIAYAICPHPVFSQQILYLIIFMGALGALGNFFIIKALSLGELSTLAPINSYKPIVALVLAFFMLNELPGVAQILAILLIILGTFILNNSKFICSKACLYRVLALIFSGSEAVFIKKLIILSDISSTFLYWAFAGLVFSLILTIKHPIKISKSNIKYELALIAMVAIMQYSTNFVFSKMNVSYALALFQLSTILSVFLGVNIFKEEGLLRKLIASFIMFFGAIILILA